MQNCTYSSKLLNAVKKKQEYTVINRKFKPKEKITTREEKNKKKMGNVWNENE